MPETAPPPLRITAEDLAAAPVPAAPPPTPARVSQLAVASLVLALLGIPLVGLLLGPIAICCGLLALGAFRRRDALGGYALAVAGVVLGAIDLVGWTIGLFLVLSRPVAPVASPWPVTAAGHGPAGIAEAPPHIRRALRANAVVRCRGKRGREVLGSGVVVGTGGGASLLLTNRHVVECGEGEAASLSAATTGGTERPAAVLWRAPEGIDAAVLQVGGEADPPGAAVPAAAAPRVGDPVFVVGNPLGYEATYTAGVLSAMRTATWGEHKLRVFQVQAAVNSGNSGGGLYDAGGHLIGLVTWSAAKDVAEGLGFAIATDELFALLRAGAPREVAALLAPGGGRGGPTP